MQYAIGATGGLIRRNRYGDFVRISALNVARVHRGHIVVVNLAAGNRAVGIRRTRLRRRVQLAKRPAGFRTAIYEVSSHARGAALPCQRHGVLLSGGGSNSSPRESNIEGRVRRV